MSYPELLRHIAFYSIVCFVLWSNVGAQWSNPIFSGLAYLHGIFRYMIAFTFGFFVNWRLRAWEVILTNIQGYAHGLTTLSCMIAGGVGKDDHASALRKHTLYRYLNLAHFMPYWGCVNGFKKITYKDLQLCGLLTEREAEVLHSSDAPCGEVFRWIGLHVQLMGAAKHFTNKETKIEKSAFGSNLSAYQKSKQLQESILRSPPMMYIQVMNRFLLFYSLITPVAFAYELDQSAYKDSGYKDHVAKSLAFVVGFIVLCLQTVVFTIFFECLLKVSASLEQPFGNERCGFDIDAYMLMAERDFWGMLSWRDPLNQVELFEKASGKEKHGKAGAATGGEQPTGELTDQGENCASGQHDGVVIKGGATPQ